MTREPVSATPAETSAAHPPESRTRSIDERRQIPFDRRSTGADREEEDRAPRARRRILFGAWLGVGTPEPIGRRAYPGVLLIAAGSTAIAALTQRHFELSNLTMVKSGKVRRIPLPPDVLSECEGRIGRLSPFPDLVKCE